MDKELCFDKISKTGIIAVIRAESSNIATRIIDSIKRGGLHIIEVTFTVPNAQDVIYSLKQNHDNGEIIIGAGTVMDSETAAIALKAGADFIVSPNTNMNILRLCNRYRKLYLPGAMTVNEIVSAMEAGADAVKIFPGSVLGPNFIKDVRGPLPHAKLIPTGGVNIGNIEQWIKNGAVAVGVGSELTVGAKTGDYDLVTSTTKKYLDIIRRVKIETEINH